MIKSEKLNYIFESKRHIGILFLRLFIGSRVIYGVVDNIFNWGQMIEFSEFLKEFSFPLPLFAAVLSVYVQFIAGSLILLGYKTRIAAFLLILNFVVALVFVHFAGNDTIEGMTPALAMLVGSVTLLFTGADKISLDHIRT